MSIEKSFDLYKKSSGLQDGTPKIRRDGTIRHKSKTINDAGTNAEETKYRSKAKALQDLSPESFSTFGQLVASGLWGADKAVWVASVLVPIIEEKRAHMNASLGNY